MDAYDQSVCYITELRSFDQGQGQGHIIIGQDELEQNKAMWWSLSLVYILNIIQVCRVSEN